jgi:TetR/AcrR family transcriptional repressor of nem operon
MSIGRPLAYSPDKVLDAAMRLFWRQGYEATSMQDLMKSMQLSKSSLYQAFGNKHQLFLRCMKRYHEITITEMQNQLARCQTGLDFISETLYQVVNQDNVLANPRGCLVTNTATEFSQSDSAIAISVRKGLMGYQSVFMAAAIKGQADGSIRTDWDPDVLSQYLVTSMSGLRTMVKAGIGPAALRQTVAVIVETVQ